MYTGACVHPLCLELLLVKFKVTCKNIILLSESTIYLTGFIYDIHSSFFHSKQSDPEAVPSLKQRKVGSSTIIDTCTYSIMFYLCIYIVVYVFLDEDCQKCS